MPQKEGNVISESQRHEDDGLVLLVDDDPEFAQRVRNLLGRSIPFGWLKEPVRAVNVIWRAQPHWILMDLDKPADAPGRGGALDIIERLSPEQRRSVIAVSNGARPDALRRLKSLGIERVYLKSEPLSCLLHMLLGL